MSGRIAFLGLGAMGFGMATNLLKKSHHVTGFDVWAPTLEKFSKAGGKTATTPRETVSGAQYVVFMVATAAQILSALFEGPDAAVHALEKEAVVILSSTGPPEHSSNVRRLLDQAGRQDVDVVDAPVSGGTIRAADGTLTILASGPEKSVAAAKPVLDAMAGTNLWNIPGGLGMGTNVKMVHQVLAGIHILMASEAMAFAAALGLDTAWAFAELKKGKGSSWMFENRGPHMIVKDDKIYSALNIIVKDIGIVTAGGRAARFPLFLASTTEQILASGVSAGLGSLDDACLVGVYLPKDPTLVLKLGSSPETASKDANKLKLVSQVMAGVHLASAAEAMCLGKIVGLDTQQLFEIIAGAAGNSVMFKESVPQLLRGKWESGRTIDAVIAELTESMEEANKLKFPLHLTGTALQLFQLVQLKGLGNDPDVAISTVWEGAQGSIFPKSSV